MTIEVVKLAREVIQDYIDEYGPHEKDSGAAYTLMKLDQAIEQAQKQEPVAWITQGGKGWLRWHKSYDDNKDSVPLYTSPPQRQPLTDEQINEIADEFIVNYRIPAGSHYDFVRAIEAAHGIKELKNE